VVISWGGGHPCKGMSKEEKIFGEGQLLGASKLSLNGPFIFNRRSLRLDQSCKRAFEKWRGGHFSSGGRRLNACSPKASGPGRKFKLTVRELVAFENIGGMDETMKKESLKSFQENHFHPFRGERGRLKNAKGGTGLRVSRDGQRDIL